MNSYFDNLLSILEEIMEAEDAGVYITEFGQHCLWCEGFEESYSRPLHHKKRCPKSRYSKLSVK